MYDNKTILKLHFDGVSIRQIAERSKKIEKHNFSDYYCC